MHYFLIATIQSKRIIINVKKSYFDIGITPSQGPGFNRQPFKAFKAQASTLAHVRHAHYTIGIAASYGLRAARLYI